MGVGLLLSVAGTAFGMMGQQKQQNAQKRAARANYAQSQLENQRNRLETIRKARIERAQSLQASANSGAGESSTSIGAAESIQGQMEANLGFLGASSTNATKGYQAQQEGFAGESMADTGNALKTAGSVISSIGSNADAKANKLAKAREA